VVEDRATAREAIAAMLDREPGFTVQQAASLREARALLPGVDLAVVDLGLPDGDGTDLVAHLKALNPEAEALVVTSSIDPSEADRALERGAAAVVNKLTDFEGIVDAVKRLGGPMHGH
jgi:DNA-binding NarL/FixJ family response regulator